MFVFVCARCEAELTTPLSQVCLPAHARQSYGNGIQLPVLMEAGTFAVDPEPWGPPWRLWDEIDPREAEARGIYAPVPTLSDGVPGAVAIAPGDARGTGLIPGRNDGGCCGLDGRDGPNTACEVCALPVATRIDDCSLWQALWFTPTAVHRLRVGSADAVAPLSWRELTENGKITPPLEPIATWGGRLGTSHFWSWSPQWEAAAGRALAHLVAASEGQPVQVPDGLTAEVFQRALDTLLPTGPTPRRAVLAGPGLPAGGADILLVPVHPETGRTWAPDGPARSVPLVPLPLGVWLSLALHPPGLPHPASGGIPADVLRDEPLPPHPGLFRADRRAFQRTLARLPAARNPWLCEALENVPHSALTGLF
ncbi:hypothetical protein [Streptomyces sp. NPDC050264]|uniref:hypothetical protein n=1 Tax=Streptomyces sp. NPDC050264 TaxID=3155038 RepID=UPI003420A9EF